MLSELAEAILRPRSGHRIVPKLVKQAHDIEKKERGGWDEGRERGEPAGQMTAAEIFLRPNMGGQYKDGEMGSFENSRFSFIVVILSRHRLLLSRYIRLGLTSARTPSLNSFVELTVN